MSKARRGKRNQASSVVTENPSRPYKAPPPRRYSFPPVAQDGRGQCPRESWVAVLKWACCLSADVKVRRNSARPEEGVPGCVQDPALLLQGLSMACAPCSAPRAGWMDGWMDGWMGGRADDVVPATLLLPYVLQPQSAAFPIVGGTLVVSIAACHQWD
ncbi:hypothetical protein SKAU_G00025400 [Synaphobranchus kaupii]|uniref:Uncharacterized protein n=1 Tax=Synaphobranchus kaupii TaxID=118154 RepID=A0A9Q1JEW8_SYNKA|nr:hypothetical protein SKAU_G00025400 [Synaphobranchus kaupii]